MSFEWWRSWHGAPTDNKWLLIARKAGVVPGIVSAIAWALMDYASQNSTRGSIAGFDIETYAEFSGFPEADIEAVIAALRAKKVIGADDRLTAWDKRQPKREDDSTQRVREYRARQKALVTDVTMPPVTDVTQCNAAKHEVTLDEIREDKDKIREDERRAEPEESTDDAAADFTEQLRQFSNDIGLIGNQPQADEMTMYLTDLQDRDVLDWWPLAIQAAIDNNAPKWSYVRAILKNCLRTGRPPGASKPGSNGAGAKDKSGIVPATVRTGDYEARAAYYASDPNVET